MDAERVQNTRPPLAGWHEAGQAREEKGRSRSAPPRGTDESRRERRTSSSTLVEAEANVELEVLRSRGADVHPLYGELERAKGPAQPTAANFGADRDHAPPPPPPPRHEHNYEIVQLSRAQS